MKSQVAAEIAAAASLARSGWRPARGELLIVAVVDEETGGSLGAEWITRNHPEKVRCDMLVNEGGGAVFEYDGRRCYGVCCAEKGVFRFKVITDGVAGHASMPGMGENALLKMGSVLERFAARQPSYRPTEEALAFLRGIGEDPEHPEGSVARLRAADPRLAIMFEPMLGATFTPTRISASEKINVIPSRAELKVDCRVPPGLGEEEVRAGIAEVLGDGGDSQPPDWRIEFTERVVGNRSPVASTLMDTISAWIAEHDPGARGGAGGAAGLHRLAPLPPGLPRVRRLRLLPPAPSVADADRAADPRRGRAHRRARPGVCDGAFQGLGAACPRLKVAALDRGVGNPHNGRRCQGWCICWRGCRDEQAGHGCVRLAGRQDAVHARGGGEGRRAHGGEARGDPRGGACTRPSRRRLRPVSRSRRKCRTRRSTGSR